jgi:DNA-binding NarL/FixJ family response regulator
MNQPRRQIDMRPVERLQLAATETGVQRGRPHCPIRHGQRGDQRGRFGRRVLAIGDFIQAVNGVAGGGTAIDPDVVSQLLGRRREHDPLDELTTREREILALIAEGRSNHGICEKLYRSPKTVEGHVHNIFGKLSIAAAPDDHRRVLAVLAYLRS